jgi:ribosome-binding ATPase YchF (GTP1/OBG family)
LGIARHYIVQKIQKIRKSRNAMQATRSSKRIILLLSSSSKRIKYILQKDCCTIWECRQRETNVKRVRVTKAPTIIIANGHRKMAINKLKQQLLIHPVK